MRPAIAGPVLFLLALTSAAAAGQAPPVPQTKTASAPRTVVYRGRLVGVYDMSTGEPIEGAEVRDLLSGLSALTTRTGTLSLFFVDTSGTMIRVRKVGYEAQTMMVSNLLTDTIPLTLTLARSGQMLPTVVTTDSSPHYKTALLRGFEERRSEGRGYFIPEATLQKESTRKLSDVIRSHVPGVNFVKGGSTAYYLTTNRGESTKMDGTACYPSVFLDGVVLTPTEDIKRRPVTRTTVNTFTNQSSTTTSPGVVGIDLSQFTVSDFAGVEFYNTATVPPQFNVTGPGCGALLLWSRER
jgi:hypothetical protein